MAYCCNRSITHIHMLPHVQLFYFIILFFSIEFKNMQKDGARQWVQTWPVSELQSNKSYYHLISRETVNQIIKATWIVFQYLWSSHSRDSISFKHISWHWVICQLILTSTVSSLPISNPQRSENLFWREAPTARTLPLEALSFSKKRIASQVSISS